MTDDLVTRLGYHHEHPVTGAVVLINPDGPEAAARIEADAATIARLEEECRTLKMIVDANIEKHRSRAEVAEARVKQLEQLDSEAATYVESVIALRTHFTGEPPYVGWKGLGLALNEALDAKGAAEAKVAALVEACEAMREGYGAHYIDMATWQKVTDLADAAIAAAKED